MKKLFILAIALFTTQIFAQQKGSIELGLLGGVGISSVSGIDNFDGLAEFNYDPVFAYNFGGSAHYYFSDRVGLRARVHWERKGYADEIIRLDGRRDFSITDLELDYITVPVTASFNFGQQLDWYVNIGLYGGFLQSATETTFGSDQEFEFESFDFGLAWSIGYRHQIASNAKLFIELDSQNGFVDLFENRPGNDFRLNRTGLNFGVVFLLK